MTPIKIYTTSYCAYCFAAKRLLSHRGYPFEEIDVEKDSALRARVSSSAGNYRTVPMIFVGEEFIGGYDELAALDRSGRLEPKLRADSQPPIAASR
jgi:glutaredoxin 3